VHPLKTKRTPREPWSYPSFWLFSFGQTLSTAGVHMQRVAAVLFIHGVTGSAAAVGVGAALAFGPCLVCGPLGGTLLDRFDARRLAIVLNVMSAIPVGLMALMAFAGHLSLGWLYVLVFAGAIPIGLIRPVIGLVGASTVPMECRHSAIALLSLSYNVSLIVGASVGGLLVHSVGAWLVFGLNAVSFLFGAATLTRVRLAPDAAGPVAAGPAASESRVAPKLRDAATVLREMPFLRVAAVTGTAFFILVAPVQHLMPAVVGEDASAILVGVIVGSIGAGAALANPIIGRQEHSSRQNQRLLQLGLLIATAGLVVLAFGAQYGIVVVLLAAMLIGIAQEFVNSAGMATATVGVPFEMRGRSMGVLSVVVDSGCALGAIGLGLLADQLGTTWMLLVAAGVVLIVFGYLMSRPAGGPTSPGRGAPGQQFAVGDRRGGTNGTNDQNGVL